MKYIAPRIPEDHVLLSGMLCRTDGSSFSGYHSLRAATEDESLFHVVRQLVAKHGLEKVVDYATQSVVDQVMEG